MLTLVCNEPAWRRCQQMNQNVNKVSRQAGIDREGSHMPMGTGIQGDRRRGPKSRVMGSAMQTRKRMPEIMKQFFGSSEMPARSAVISPPPEVPVNLAEAKSLLAELLEVMATAFSVRG